MLKVKSVSHGSCRHNLLIVSFLLLIQFSQIHDLPGNLWTGTELNANYYSVARGWIY